MVFTIHVANYRLYFNLSGGDRLLTLSVSGQVAVELKAPNGARVVAQVLPNQGGVVSLRVPAQHFVEIDAPTTGVQVEVLAVDNP